jgi:hypothetical protein
LFFSFSRSIQDAAAQSGRRTNLHPEKEPMSRTIRACLLLAPLLGGIVGTTRAAERIVVGPIVKRPAEPAGPVVVPVSGADPAHREPRPVPQPSPGYWPKTPAGARELPPGYPPVNNDHSPTPVRDWWYNGRPLTCWASFNGYGCQSLHSTLGFMFGSCRQFYGEPCLKGAPPSPLPPWAGPESGYHGDKPLPNENGREPHWMLSPVRKMGGCPSCQ